MTLARRRVKHYGYQFHYVVRLSSGLACSPRKLIIEAKKLMREAHTHHACRSSHSMPEHL